MKLILQSGDRSGKIKNIKGMIALSVILFLLTLYLFIIRFDYFYILIPIFLLSIVFLYLRIRKNKAEKINEKMFAELFKKY